MRFSVGILDVSAAIVVAVVIVLPPKQTTFAPLPIDAAQRAAIGALQARLAAGGGAKVAEDLADQLVDIGQSDWALRVAGAASAADAPARWIALRAISTVHAERIEIDPAYKYATLALDACKADPATCPAHEQVRLRLYHDELEAGVRSRIDPRDDPEGFREAVQGAVRVIYPRPGKRADDGQTPPSGGE